MEEPTIATIRRFVRTFNDIQISSYENTPNNALVLSKALAVLIVGNPLFRRFKTFRMTRYIVNHLPFEKLTETLKGAIESIPFDAFNEICNEYSKIANLISSQNESFGISGIKNDTEA